MDVIDLELEGVKLIKPKVHSDNRGFFKELYNKKRYKECGIDIDFVQDNHSFSRKDVIRGMHYQNYPGQDKLVTVIYGKILDVAVDIRPFSKTFKKHLAVELDAQDGYELFIPKGFAHGFCVLSDYAHVVYKVSSLFNEKEEKAFHCLDKNTAIPWPTKTPILSEKDKIAPLFEEAIF